MGIFDKFKKEQIPLYSNSDIVSPVKGKMIPPEEIEDAVFQEQMMGQTIGIIPSDNVCVCPVNGIVKMVFPTKHAYGIQAYDGKSYLVHIGVDTVGLNGKGFKSFITQEQEVKAGQKAIEFDLDVIKNANLDTTVMLIVTENTQEPIAYIDYGLVDKGQKINK